MVSLTSCDLSRDTNVFKDNESNEDTEPGHCTSILLWVVPAIGNFKHGCKGFDCVSASVAFALVRFQEGFFSGSLVVSLTKLIEGNIIGG